jgi:hypothetical protein
MLQPIPALLLAALLPAAAPQPRCRAELAGETLTTTLVYPGGYSVAGPWRVLQKSQASADGVEPVLVVDVALDRVIEADGLTGRRTTTPLVRPVTLTFEAPDEPALVDAAARTWCQTVLRARAGSAATGRPLPNAGRIT